MYRRVSKLKRINNEYDDDGGGYDGYYGNTMVVIDLEVLVRLWDHVVHGLEAGGEGEISGQAAAL